MKQKRIKNSKVKKKTYKKKKKNIYGGAEETNKYIFGAVIRGAIQDYDDEYQELLNDKYRNRSKAVININDIDYIVDFTEFTINDHLVNAKQYQKSNPRKKRDVIGVPAEPMAQLVSEPESVPAEPEPEPEPMAESDFEIELDYIFLYVDHKTNSRIPYEEGNQLILNLAYKVDGKPIIKGSNGINYIIDFTMNREKAKGIVARQYRVENERKQRKSSTPVYFIPNDKSVKNMDKSTSRKSTSRKSTSRKSTSHKSTSHIIQVITDGIKLNDPIYTDDGSLIEIPLFCQEAAFLLQSQLGGSGDGKKISIQVAGNALRPGGGTGKLDGSDLSAESQFKTPYYYTTQEESIVDSLMHAEKIISEDQKRKPNYRRLFRNLIGDNANLEDIYPPDKANVGKRGMPWGCVYPDYRLIMDPRRIEYKHKWNEWNTLLESVESSKPGFIKNLEDLYNKKGEDQARSMVLSNGLDKEILIALKNKMGAASIQGHDFTEPFPEGNFNQTKADTYSQKYNFAFTIKDKPIGLSSKKYDDVKPDISTITICDVVYVYGPNAFYNSKGYKGQSEYGAGTRSRIPYLESINKKFNENEYLYFRECVKMAFRATLTSMKLNNINYPILCYVSGGIYGGYGSNYKSETGKRIRRETPSIIREIDDELRRGGPPIFKNIFLCG